MWTPWRTIWPVWRRTRICGRPWGRRLYDKARECYSIDSTIDKQEEIYQTILRRQGKRDKRYGALVCGAYGKGNAGDDAILEAIVKELRDIDPDLPLWVLSRRPKETRLKYRVNAFYTFRVDKFRRRLAHSQLYINGGGSLMQDVTSRRSLWFYLLTLSMAHRRHNKVLMYGCGIGPIPIPLQPQAVRQGAQPLCGCHYPAGR